MSPVTFPFPPPPAALGLIGAIMGIPKTDYHKDIGWNRLKIAVRLLFPVQILRSALNLINTKDGTDKYFRPRANTNTHIQVNFEFLKNPGFRIFVAGLTPEMHTRLKSLLMNGKTIYTPVLGLAQCIANIEWIGEYSAEQVNQREILLDSVISLNEQITPHYETGRRYQRTRIPAEMDGNRVVHRYQEILLAEDCAPIRCVLNERAEVYQVGNETVSFL